MAFYDNANKKYAPGIVITKSSIKSKSYNFYKFKKPISLSPKCMIYGGQKWKIHIYLNKLIAENPYMTNFKWDVYISLKFVGPAFSSKDQYTENLVLCDRVILVKRSLN
jgi:hypothetical protein